MWRPRPWQSNFRNHRMITLHIAASLAFATLLYSLSEYVVHRWLMHRMRLANFADSDTMRELVRNHMGKHHKRDYHHDNHDEDDKLWQVQLFGLIPVGLVESALFFLDPITCAVVFVYGLGYASFWWVVHLEMHRCEGRFFSRTALFRHLELRHQYHHEFPNTNFNVILPFGDWLFGTYPSKDQRAKLAAGLRRKTAHRPKTVSEAA